MEAHNYEAKARSTLHEWRKDWNLFARDALQINLDPEQQEILSSVQHNKRTSVVSGTARGKDVCAAVAAISFLYLTPRWNDNGDMTENTLVVLSAPSDRQIQNIMVPEFTRLFNNAKKSGVDLPGRLVGYDIRTDNKQWFLTGFKADEYKTEAWAGLHASNILFCLTEASGIPELVYSAIEGNLQGNSRILLVFNPNTSVGYAARSQKEAGWAKFRLSSLTAPNVLAKKIKIPGQVDYDWIIDKLHLWCLPIDKSDFISEEGDFEFEGNYYRPNDDFRKKVLGLFPKVDEASLIPQEWIELANKNWMLFQANEQKGLRLGVDVAGMGRDSSVFCYRYDNYVTKFRSKHSGGKANHMEIAGIISNEIRHKGIVVEPIKPKAFIDTIGEGAGVFSRTQELGITQAYSCKYSEAAKDHYEKDLTDITGQYQFANMRAYLFWAVRDWLNPANKMNAALPPNESLLEEATEIKWKFQSNGRIIIEPKEDIKERIKKSTDHFDALANTFYPEYNTKPSNLRNKIGALT